MSLLPHLDDTECTALLRAAHHFNAFISPAYEAYRQRQLAHIRACLAECDRTKTPDEIERAIERAAQDAREEGRRREPEQKQLTLAA